MMTRINRRRLGLSLPVLAGTLLACGLTTPALAGTKKAPAPPAPAATLEEAGLRFESARLLGDAERPAALEEALRITDRAIQRGTDDEKSAARFLSGEIQFGLGRYGAASGEFRQAEDGLRKTPFADDAAFAAIQASEAAGRDAEAAKAWIDWKGRYPQSPLMGEAGLAQAWNALRRGDPTTASKTLASLTAERSWYATDPRVVLAQATLLYERGNPAEAVALLGPKPSGTAAIYLRALCLLGSGSLLRAAAAFQDVADRDPESSLRDFAILAKADAFLRAKDYRSAAEEFAGAAKKVRDENVRAEAELRAAGATYLAGSVDSSLTLLRGIVARRAGTDVAARAQFLIGESLFGKKKYAEAIVELNRVLTNYFQHSVAASAQYRVARCLDALGRGSDATGTYQTVVSGYPLEPEAPAAAYLAGVGLLSQNRPMAAAPYFQIVLDRYATRSDSSTSTLTFASTELGELVDASLCLLEYAYHKAGNIGQLAGAPHLMLQRMPPSRSPWRAWALLIDADASAAQGRYAEAQATLERLTRDFPGHPIGASATKLLAWTYARQGRDSLAIASEERLVAVFGASGNAPVVSGALLDIARYRFNQKRYRDAAATYEMFLKRYPDHADRLSARYQAGLCYARLNRAGDAVDQWEAVVRDSAGAPIAERAWARAGDLYFTAQRYAEAKRCYTGLLEHFASTDVAALATLRLAQCEYNAGNDAAALAGFAKTQEQYPGSPAAREAKRGTELALYRLGQTAKGSEVLETLIEKYPTSAFAADAQFQIAKRNYQKESYAQAAEGFRRVVSQFPGYSAADQAQFLLADSYARSGSAAEARLAYEQFLSFFLESDLRSTVEFRLGLMQFESKEYAQAAVAFTRVLEESVSTEMKSASRYNLALCQKVLGQADEARGSLERFRVEQPNDPRAADVAFQLGDMDESGGNLKGAEQNFEAAASSARSRSLEVEAQYRLGRCREALGNPDGALRAYLQAAASTERKNAFRVSALTRCAAIYESRKSFTKAYDIYLDIARNSQDQELAALAKGRASQLQPGTKKR
ncbi:MAG: tetratricopeptide repeat protein [Candidatus Eisenbacteria bacterium]|uniref:Tetratricopeptide repeat protein n=1 Tax=Eiseniibacteriota bacterium TaxID=2212470 RepID=A0A538S6M5_UNCEI|nr:MAG: tetratricopeptide repeat protein [Candidatus Eisenbacteria bacterium]